MHRNQSSPLSLQLEQSPCSSEDPAQQKKEKGVKKSPLSPFAFLVEYLFSFLTTPTTQISSFTTLNSHCNQGVPNDACELSHFSYVRLFATPWTVARQAPLSMGILLARIRGFLPYLACHALLQGIFPTRDQTPISRLLHWRAGPLHHLGSPFLTGVCHK